MAEIQIPETPHERRVTWSLMAAVVIFVLVMSCIVIWVTTSLIQEERGQTSRVTPSGALATATGALSTGTPTKPFTVTPTARQVEGARPMLDDPTWTPVPGPKKFVRFLYWKVVPSRIKYGDCIQLTWDTEYAASLKLYRNGELFVDRAPAGTTLKDCPTQLGYVVYRLVAWNKAGESNWIQLQVKVVAP